MNRSDYGVCFSMDVNQVGDYKKSRGMLIRRDSLPEKRLEVQSNQEVPRRNMVYQPLIDNLQIET